MVSTGLDVLASFTTADPNDATKRVPASNKKYDGFAQNGGCFWLPCSDLAVRLLYLHNKPAACSQQLHWTAAMCCYWTPLTSTRLPLSRLLVGIAESLQTRQ